MFDENKFKKIYDQRHIGQQLIAIKDRSEPVYIWRFIGDKKVLAQVQIDFVKRSKSEFKLSPVPGQERLYAQVAGVGSELNLFFPESSLLFQTRAKSADAESLLAAFPPFLAQVERRKSLRLGCEGKPVRAVFAKEVLQPRPAKQQFNKSLTDLSDGGCALVLTRVESKFFSPGDLVGGIDLRLDEQSVPLKAEVVRVQEMLPNGIEDVAYRSWKLTLKFIHLDPKQREQIAKFVFEHLNLQAEAI